MALIWRSNSVLFCRAGLDQSLDLSKKRYCSSLDVAINLNGEDSIHSFGELLQYPEDEQSVNVQLNPPTALNLMPCQTTHILDNLKLSQLQTLAVSLGTQCSGTKTAIKSSIRQILPKAASDTTRLRRPLSLVSIDMGIRNLAYAHITADLDRDVRLRKGVKGGCYQRPRLRAWEKIAIGPSDTSESEFGPPPPDISALTPCAKPIHKPPNPSDHFAPHLYAVHAVSLIKRIMAHKPTPTHILIERQRFRSGGSPIVQDWSIRVGVFEGMLYAVLRTLAEIETGNRTRNGKDEVRDQVNVDVEGVLPGRVVRYWANEGGAGETAAGVSKPKGKAMKKLKVDLVGRALEEALRLGAGRTPSTSTSTSTSLGIDATALPMVSAYLGKWTKESRSRSPPSMKHDSESSRSVPELSKLDDLADCLLQGMAWIEWENNRARLVASEDIETMLSV